ncbi:hypothetical protein ACFRIB_00210 [Streptomyces mirabilis]|uniref:hypothetical protein n=1 Tax=Streptomyces mirabilis TaxID=68239 RepID=UPI0036B6D7C5
MKQLPSSWVLWAWILGEGVDITGERGVKAICFADTRGPQVEIVQNIGRALRLNRAPPVMTGFGRRERIDYAPSVSRAGPRRRAQRCVAFTTVCSFKDG